MFMVESYPPGRNLKIRFRYIDNFTSLSYHKGLRPYLCILILYYIIIITVHIKVNLKMIKFISRLWYGKLAMHPV